MRVSSWFWLAPGLYLLDLSLKAEFETIRHLRPLSVAY